MVEGPGFIDWIQDKWRGYAVDGNPCFRFAKKLKLLKKDLKVWNMVTFGDIKQRMDKFLEEVRCLGEKEGKEVLSAEEVDGRASLKSEIQRLLVCEEISWRQKSRVQWLKEGDCNKKFFYRMTNAHKRDNQIIKASINGTLLEDLSDVREGITGFYENTFKEKNGWCPKLEGVAFKTLNVEDKESLETPFSEEEIETRQFED